jgi:hypothetical protein
MRTFIQLAAVVVLLSLAVPPSAQAHPCGDEPEGSAWVEWRGSWWPARVLGRPEPGQTLIRYDGYDARWDEVVGPDRLLEPSALHPGRAATAKVGAKVLVAWGGSLWPARVLQVAAPGRWRIRYDGYDAGWDEEVGPDRLWVFAGRLSGSRGTASFGRRSR